MGKIGQIYTNSTTDLKNYTNSIKFLFHIRIYVFEEQTEIILNSRTTTDYIYKKVNYLLKTFSFKFQMSSYTIFNNKISYILDLTVLENKMNDWQEKMENQSPVVRIQEMFGWFHLLSV